MTTSINQFEDNFHGILTHRGEVKIAKGDVEQEILYIDDDGIILVDGGKKSIPNTNTLQAIVFNSICKRRRYSISQIYKRRSFYCWI